MRGETQAKGGAGPRGWARHRPHAQGREADSNGGPGGAKGAGRGTQAEALDNEAQRTDQAGVREDGTTAHGRRS
eukprot:11064783-Alexandrium_andersonii.AAC.1